MNIHQLKLALETSSFPASTYIIGDRPGNEQWAIAKTTNGIWTIYFWERGQRSIVKEFTEEEKACAYFLESLKSMLR